MAVNANMTIALVRDGTTRRETNVALFVTDISLSICILIFNMLVLIVFKKSRMQSTVHFLLKNISVASLLFGVGYFLKAIISMVVVWPMCHIKLITCLIACNASATFVLILCCNMFVVIRRCHVQQADINRKIIYGLVAATWCSWTIISFSILLIPATPEESFCFTGPGHLFFLKVLRYVRYGQLGPMLLFGLATLCTILKRTSQIKCQPIANSDVAAAASNRRMMARRRYMAVTVACVFGVKVICWLPLIILMILDVACANRCENSDQFFSDMSRLACISSLAYLFIYVVRIPEFRRSIGTMVHKSFIGHDDPSKTGSSQVNINSISASDTKNVSSQVNINSISAMS